MPFTYPESTAHHYILRVYSTPLHTQSLQHTITYSESTAHHYILRVYSIPLHTQESTVFHYILKSLQHTITYSESTAFHYMLRVYSIPLHTQESTAFHYMLRVYSIPLHTQESTAFHYILRVYSMPLHTQKSPNLTISSVHIGLACCSQPDTLLQYSNKKVAVNNENPVVLSATCCGAKRSYGDIGQVV